MNYNKVYGEFVRIADSEKKSFNRFQLTNCIAKQLSTHTCYYYCDSLVNSKR